MARTIASLAVSLGLNSQGFNQGLDEAGRKAGGLRGTMGNVAKGVGIAAGVVTAAGGAMLAMADKTSKTADEIDKMSIRTGLSREQLQELRFAAGQTGVSFSAIESASSRMVGTLRTNEEAFEDMGIATRDASGNLRSADELFNETIRSLAAMDNEMERNVKGQELFGRGFNELIPLIDAGAEGIDAYAKQAHELGSVLSDEAIAANVKYRDTMDAVKTAMQGAFVQIMTEILPILQRFLDWLLDNMPEIQAVISTVMGVVAKVVSTTFAIFEAYVLPILKTVFDWLQRNMPQIQAFFEKAFEVAATVIGVLVTVIKDFLLPGLAQVYEWVSPTLPVIQNIFETTFEVISRSIGFVIDTIKTFIDWLQRGLEMIRDYRRESAKLREAGGSSARNLDHLQSFAVGTPYVPYDMVAQIHKGEMIVPARMNPFNPSASGSGAMGNIVNNFSFTGPLNVRDDQDIERIAKELYHLQRTRNRGV